MTVLRRTAQLIEDLKALNVIDEKNYNITYKANDDYYEITIKKHNLAFSHINKDTIIQAFKDEFPSNAKFSNSLHPIYTITCTINKPK